MRGALLVRVEVGRLAGAGAFIVAPLSHEQAVCASPARLPLGLTVTTLSPLDMVGRLAWSRRSPAGGSGVPVDEFLTVAEVSAILKLNQMTVPNWIDQGPLNVLRSLLQA